MHSKEIIVICEQTYLTLHKAYIINGLYERNLLFIMLILRPPICLRPFEDKFLSIHHRYICHICTCEGIVFFSQQYQYWTIHISWKTKNSSFFQFIVFNDVVLWFMLISLASKESPIVNYQKRLLSFKHCRTVWFE